VIFACLCFLKKDIKIEVHLELHDKESRMFINHQLSQYQYISIA